MSRRSEISGAAEHFSFSDCYTACDYALLKARAIAELAMGWKGEEVILDPTPGSDRPTLHFSMWALTELLDEARELLDKMMGVACKRRREEGQP